MISGIVIKVCTLPQYVGGGGSCVDIIPVFFMGQSFRSCLVLHFYQIPVLFTLLFGIFVTLH